MRVVPAVRLRLVCQPFEVFDWGTEQYVQTFDGSVEGGSVTVIQAQGRTIDSGTADFGGFVTCDGATVNHFEVPVVAGTSPWRTGSAVAGASIFIADRVSFEDSDAAGTGAIVIPCPRADRGRPRIAARVGCRRRSLAGGPHRPGGVTTTR